MLYKNWASIQAAYYLHKVEARSYAHDVDELLRTVNPASLKPLNHDEKLALIKKLKAKNYDVLVKQAYNDYKSYIQSARFFVYLSIDQGIKDRLNQEKNQRDLLREFSDHHYNEDEIKKFANQLVKACNTFDTDDYDNIS